MRYKKILSVFFTIAIAVVLFYGIDYIKNSNKAGAPANNNSSEVKPTPVPNPKLEAEYEKNVKVILEKFSKKVSPLAIRDELLNVVVPDKYKNLHLDLVLTFSNIIKGSNNADQATIQDAMEKLEQLKGENGWMK